MSGTELNKISQSENLIKSKLDKQKEVIDYLLPILTALLAGLFAIRQVKMNSIASYKIRWVETLRKIISDYISKIDETNTILSNMVDDVKTAARELKIEIDDDQIFSSSKIQAIEERYYKSISEHFSIANNFALQIKLHLNPEKNKKHEKLEQDLDNYATSSVQNFRSWSDINKIERLSQSIIMQSRTILNDEINKVVKKWILF